MTSKTRKVRALEQLLSSQRQKSLDFCAALFFLALTSFFPLYMNPERYINLTMHKAYCFWAVAAIGAAGILLLFAWFRLRAFFQDLQILKEEKTGKISMPEWALIAFIVIALISAILSRHQDTVWLGIQEPNGRYEGFITLLCYCLTFVIIARFYTPRNWHLYVFAGSAASVAVIGILQYADMDIFGLFPYDHYTAVNEFGFPMYGGLTIYFRTTLGNINVVSSYVALTIPLFLALYAGSQSRWRFIYLAASMTNFGLLLIEGSDAGRVGIAAALALLLPYWLADRQRLGRLFIGFASWSAACALRLVYLQYRVNILPTRPPDRINDLGMLYSLADSGVPAFWPYLLLAAILLAVGITLVYLLKKVRWPKRAPVAGLVLVGVIIVGGIAGIEVLGSRLSDQPGNIIYQAREAMHGRMDDDFGSGRGWIWKNGLATVPDYWLIGNGPDTFFYALGDELQAESAANGGVYIDKAHNHFLQIAVTVGIPALLCYLVFLYGIFVPSVRKAFKSPLLLAAGAGCIAYVVQAFFSVDVPIASPLYWAMLGVMACEMRNMDKNSLQEAAE